MLAAISEFDSSIPLLLGAHQSIGIKAVTLFGTDQQKKKYPLSFK
jgi:hypothetical protein